jgi:RES domain-containing protein
MLEAWRIVKRRQAPAAFTGDGAARTGGRWNSRGVSVVYTSSTQALAALETLVHLNPPVLFEYIAIRIQFPEELVETLPTTSLPRNWRTEPPPPSTKAIGDAWVWEGRSAILALPSVIIAKELNYLINPAHPGFKTITIGKREPFSFDPRLLK